MNPSHIGRYQVLSERGRGGMAAVYHAYDPLFKRDVAIKVLPREFLHDPTFRAHFEREAQALVALDHPAIVPVYDFGEEGGQSYLVMRYLSGGSLAERIEQGPLPLSESAALLRRIAPALDEAHRRGIVHQDLKPGNILFDRYGNAYLADFGVARLVPDAATLTASGAAVGTPAYMSPEQVHGEDDLDERSDIYSLGVVLFEMLSGRPPHRPDTPPRVMMKRVLDPIPDILTLRPDLPPGCDSIIRRAMARNPDDRFSTAGQMAAALSAITGGESEPSEETIPVQPMPPTRRVEVRHPPISRSSRLVTRTLIALWFGIAALVAVLLGVLNIERGVRLGLVTPTPAILIERPLKPVEVVRLSDQPVGSVAWSPGGGRLAYGTADGEVFVWDFEHEEHILILDGHSGQVSSLAWSPDGAMLASSSRNGRILIWDARMGELLYWLEERGVTPSNIAWSPDSSRIAIGRSAGQVVVRDLASVDSAWLTDHLHAVLSVGWSPDGTLLASAGEDGAVIVWDAQTGERLKVLAGSVVAWSPGGTMLASASYRTVLVWSARTGARLRTLTGHTGDVNGLAWSPDGLLLASGAADETVILWDVGAGRVSCVLEGQTGGVNGVAWSSRGALLATASEGGLIVWELHK